MGPADYLSRNPTGKATFLSEEDKNFVIITIEEIKFFLLRIALTPIGANKPTNENTDTTQFKIDVINPKRVSCKTNNSFCLNTRTIQSNINSHFPIPKSTNSETIYKHLNENIVGITN